jgi:hypothetical protein
MMWLFLLTTFSLLVHLMMGLSKSGIAAAWRETSLSGHAWHTHYKLKDVPFMSPCLAMGTMLEQHLVMGLFMSLQLTMLPTSGAVLNVTQGSLILVSLTHKKETSFLCRTFQMMDLLSCSTALNAMEFIFGTWELRLMYGLSGLNQLKALFLQQL